MKRAVADLRANCAYVGCAYIPKYTRNAWNGPGWTSPTTYSCLDNLSWSLRGALRAVGSTQGSHWEIHEAPCLVFAGPTRCLCVIDWLGTRPLGKWLGAPFGGLSLGQLATVIPRNARGIIHLLCRPGTIATLHRPPRRYGCSGRRWSRSVTNVGATGRDLRPIRMLAVSFNEFALNQQLKSSGYI